MADFLSMPFEDRERKAAECIAARARAKALAERCWN